MKLIPRILLIAAYWAAATATSADELSDPALRRGQAVYAKSCASCHGDKGQGVKAAYEQPLIGDDSISVLAKRIAETMPEDDPDACVGEDADAVAAYVHHAFYSEAARLRNRPPRVTLTHLTANQLRQSLADLYGRFTGAMWVEPKRGITGLYFKGARFKRENKKIERVDAAIDFDWMHDGPGEGIEPEDFFVQWRGGLKVDETGRYEIVIRSTCAFICRLGRFDRELINNRVQSGDKTEFRKSITLAAGRVYPIQVELFQRKRKTEQPPARISLSWVPPHGSERLIAERHFLPTSPPATFALQAKLPPDDRSYGFDRGLRVDRQWDESTTNAAVEFAQAAADELWPRYRRDHRRDPNENRAILRSFLTTLAETAFRGPLTDDERQFYVDQQVDQTEDDTAAIQRSLLVTLKSPRFLYPTLDSSRSASQRAANRLALTLFDSLPADKWLLKQARENKLQTTGQLRAAARRMVRDYRSRAKTRELLYEWLNLSDLDEIAKDSDAFPDFDQAIVEDLKASLDAFLDEVVWGETGDFRQLFSADWAYTTPRLAAFYGETWKPHDGKDTALTRSVSDGERRFGLLTHPYLMSALAYKDTTSPIHRGVFLIRHMLGRTIRPPQEAFTPLSPDLHPNLTTRQRVERQTGAQSCQVCHHKINGLGFALENFDAVGRFREHDGENPIDSTGRYTNRDGEIVGFEGAAELARFLATSDDAHHAFVNRAFQHFVKQPVAAFGPEKLNELTAGFRDNGFRIRDLLVEIALIAASQENAVRDKDS